MSTTHGSPTPVRRPHVDPWRAAVIALAAALLALGVWVLADRDGSPPPATQGLAAPDVAAMLHDRMAALNAGDAKALSAFYARDAVLEERDVTPAILTSGSDEIGGRIAALVTMFGMQLESASPVIQLGGTVAEAASVPGYPDEGFVLVYDLDANGRIAHQWVLPAGGTGR